MLLPTLWVIFYSADCILFVASELFILIKTSVSIFSFVACAFGVIAKKLLPDPTSQKFAPMFSSKELYSFPVCICLRAILS